MVMVVVVEVVMVELCMRVFATLLMANWTHPYSKQWKSSPIASSRKQ